MLTLSLFFFSELQLQVWGRVSHAEQSWVMESALASQALFLELILPSPGAWGNTWGIPHPNIE